MTDSGYIAKISQRNKGLLSSLIKKLQIGNDLLFTDYRGLNMVQVQRLRSLLIKEGATITVVKNRIALRALESIGVAGEEYRTLLSGPTALVYGGSDSLAMLKVLIDFKKEHDLPTMKGAIIDNAFYDAERVIVVAALPSRQQLLTQLVCTAQAPVQQLANLLHTIVSRPITVLNEIAKKK